MTEQRLWQKDVAPDERLDRFTAGNDRVLDNELAVHDVLGSIAHATMLHRCGLLDDAEARAVLGGLRTILAEVRAGTFTVGAGVEDIHSQVEIVLTERIGEAGKKLHTARSRNDQVLLDIKLYTRHRLARTVAGMQRLFGLLLDRSERFRDVPMPGYTHGQIAMPSTFGLWAAAHAESLADDLELVLAAYRIADRNPLGSAAGFGSSFPIDRLLTTELLGFSGPNVNVVYAQLTRGRTERATLTALAAVASSLARLAADAVLYLGGEHGFFRLPEDLTTGSSIMPHKKNPDGFELVRAQCNLLQGLPNALALVLANLTTGYHRDLQVTKELLFPAFTKLDDCLDILCLLLERLDVRTDILDDPKYAYLFTVDAVHSLVLQGLPFREAYRIVGRAVAVGTFERPAGQAHTHLGSAGDLRNDLIAERFAALRDAFGFERAEAALAALEHG
ncbi:MAG: argininosuccinate lyase [Bacteroidetes bacterium]|nr:argininosuccinate lyase [Bacteroidota bacterium]